MHIQDAIKWMEEELVDEQYHSDKDNYKICDGKQKQ